MFDLERPREKLILAAAGFCLRTLSSRQETLEWACIHSWADLGGRDAVKSVLRQQS